MVNVLYLIYWTLDVSGTFGWVPDLIAHSTPNVSGRNIRFYKWTSVDI